LSDTFRTRPVHLVPIVASLLFGVSCAYLLLLSALEVYQVTPFQEGIGSIGNAFYFVVLTAVGATMLYILLKRRKLALISVIIGFALTSAFFLLSLIYLIALFSIFPLPYASELILVLSISLTIVGDLAVFRVRNVMIANTIVILLGGGFGAFLGREIPPLSAMLILCALAVYDVFAVYRGPVGKIARHGLEKLRGLSYSFKEVQMGLGDLTFYSMLISLVFFYAGPVYCLVSAIGVLAGAFLAFKMVERKGIFPGLPFPIALGLLPLIVWFLVPTS
jgi:presenilin-like A22 family membrane protease